MKYSYNYAYLQQFMLEKRLAKKDLLEALDCYDYTSLNKWLSGKVPVHVTAMLRLCNYYNIPVSNFFCDEDGKPCEFEVSYPNKSAQLLPTDGYGMKEGAGRGIVETIVAERKVSSPRQKEVVDEGLERQAEQRRQNDATSGQTTLGGNAPLASNIYRIKEDLRYRLRHFEETFTYERDQLMSDINSLLQELIKLQDSGTCNQQKG